jgi:hypothetical protein
LRKDSPQRHREHREDKRQSKSIRFVSLFSVPSVSLW